MNPSLLKRRTKKNGAQAPVAEETRWTIADTNAPAAVLFIRIAVGGIFLSEGIQKFLLPAALGAGRFARIGLPYPELLAPFVGCCEVSCGLLVLLGFATRLASVPLVIIMLTAIGSTKFPILLQHGFLAMAHEARTDCAMLLSALFLIMAGSGPISLDRQLQRKSAVQDARPSL